MPTSSKKRLATAVAACLLLASCRYPQDVEGTLDRASDGVLRVGAAEHGPWIRTSESGAPVGVEPDIVAAFAASINADIEWRRGSEQTLMKALQRGELDLVAAGIVDDNPWSRDVAFTRGYYENGDGSKRVFAARPGENAFIMALEKHFPRRRLAIEEMAQREARP